MYINGITSSYYFKNSALKNNTGSIFSDFKKTSVQIKSNSLKNNTAIKNIAITVGILAAIGLLIINRRNLKPSAAKKLLNKTGIQELWNEMRAFPEDIKYRKKLLKALNMPNSDMPLLRSVIGGQEYTKILKDLSDSPVHYTPGEILSKIERDNHNLTGVKNKTFRASFHNHTNNSDGHSSVKDFLEQAAKYADEVAEFHKNNPLKKAPNAPFTIAISDHDTIEGCKEAVKIISQNPDKYKNLRVLLGVELTVENMQLGSKLKKPVPLHIVCNSINPFDKKLNAFLDMKKQQRILSAKAFFKECKEKISKTDKDFAETIKYEEITNKYNMVRSGLNYPYYFIKEFIEKRMKTYNSFENNLEIKQQIQNILNELAKNYSPKLNLKPCFVNMDEVMNIITKQKNGYINFAHPAYTNIGECLHDRSCSRESIKELFRLIKQKWNDRVLGAEIYYPYEGKKFYDPTWTGLMEKSADLNGYIKTGGLDSHGKSIFYCKK